MVAAEAAYRVALAELQEFETGERPTWAPAAPASDADESADGEASADEPDTEPSEA